MKAITDFFIKYAMVLAGLAITAFGVMAFITISSVKEVIALQSLEAFEKAADGQATKIIIPSDIASLAGLATSVGELMKSE